jgi:adenylate kinase
VRLVLLGPPGAGKGTQAKMLEGELGLPQIASGDLLRTAVRAKTPLGVEARRYMDKGALVPDELVIKLIEQRLQQADVVKGYILDGFPRTHKQAEALRQMLAGYGQAIDVVAALIVPNDEIVKRISGRRTCRNCGATYHLIFDPPRNMNVCDKCNGELYQREDDAEDTVRMRLQTYDTQTKPLLEYYEQAGLLRRIDGVGSLETVHQRLKTALAGVAQRA